jgi:FkbM family methyltransferase
VVYIKSLLKRFLYYFGYKVINTESDNIFNFETFLHQHLSRYDGLFFVQIGANDGITDDPIHNFVKKYSNRISGIAIEPLPDVFEVLRNHYKKFSNIRTLNMAIHNTEKVMQLYRVDPKKLHRFHALSQGIASFDKDHHVRTSLVPPESIIAEKVNCISFEDLLEKNDIKKIDLLLIDTEGYDAEIILNLDFGKVKPSIIRFEHGLKHGHMTDEMFLRVTRFLNRNGYQLIAESYDATAYLLNPADFK